MIEEKLQNFNFSKMEAMVYVTLVKYPNLNGSQIAKLLHASRSSVYSALDNLCKRGAAYLVPGDSNTTEYKAQSPDILMENLKKEYIQNIDYLTAEFANLEQPEDDFQYINVKGEQNFIVKAKELISKAEKEICINTNYDMSVFKKDIIAARERGVRIILFSFHKHDVKDWDIEYYYNSKFADRPEEIYKKFMMVLDLKTAIISGGNKSQNYYGLFTNNPLLVFTIADHINHDIYLLKLEEQYGRGIMNINMNTLRELEFWKDKSYYRVGFDEDEQNT